MLIPAFLFVIFLKNRSVKSLRAGVQAKEKAGMTPSG